MKSLAYNPTTKKLLDATIHEMPQALLLVGDDGVGLATIARDIAWTELSGFVESADNEGNVDKSSKGTIRIEQIRNLIIETRGRNTKRQIYVIDEADKMSLQAQNACLKLLEEPVPGVVFILTSHAPQQLLPTILSRVQTLTVQRLTREQSTRFISESGVDEPRRAQQLMFLAAGKPAELTRLITDDKLFQSKAEIISAARQFIAGTPYQRAITIQCYASDRSGALEFVQQCINLTRFSLPSHPTKQLITLLDNLTDTYDRIAANGNIRLQLTNLVLQ